MVETDTRQITESEPEVGVQVSIIRDSDTIPRGVKIIDDEGEDYCQLDPEKLRLLTEQYSPDYFAVRKVVVGEYIEPESGEPYFEFELREPDDAKQIEVAQSTPESDEIVPDVESGEERGSVVREFLQRISRSGPNRAVLLSLLLITGIGCLPKRDESAKPTVSRVVETGVSASSEEILRELTVKETGERREVSFTEDELVMMPSFVYEGSVLSSGDLVRCVDELTRELFGGEAGVEELPVEEVCRRYANTVHLLRSAKYRWPQAVEFQIVRKEGKITIEPHNFTPDMAVRERKESDTVIVGGELEAIAAAVSAARNGEHVTLVYEGSLGGSRSDTGGNDRYYEGLADVPKTSAMGGILSGAFDMDGSKAESIPGNVDERLREYLASNYPEIRLVRTTLSGIHVQSEVPEGGQRAIAALVTPAGEQIVATSSDYIDYTSRGMLSEKLGLPITVEMGMPMGRVSVTVEGIDINALNGAENGAMRQSSRLIELAGGSVDQIRHNIRLSNAVGALSIDQPGEPERDDSIHEHALIASAFRVYAEALEQNATGREKETLSWLNRHRQLDTFVVTPLPDGAMVWQGLAYRFDKEMSPGSSRLDGEDSAGDVRRYQELQYLRYDSVLLQQFLQGVLANRHVEVRLPHELSSFRSESGIDSSIVDGVSNLVEVRDPRFNAGRAIVVDMLHPPEVVLVPVGEGERRRVIPFTMPRAYPPHSPLPAASRHKAVL